MPRFGIVIETRPDAALVSTSPRGPCAECSDRSGCSLESALGRVPAEELLVMDPLGARVGDQVEFDLPGRTELQVSLLIWALPVAGILAGAILGPAVPVAAHLDPDVASLIGAVAGLVLGLLPAVIADRRLRRGLGLVPRIIRIHPSTCPPGPVSDADRPLEPSDAGPGQS